MPVRSYNCSGLGYYKMAGSEKICKVRVNSNTSGPIPYSQLLDLRSAETLNQRVASDSTADFLEDLPSHNENNFSRFQPDTSIKNSAMKKSTLYFPTKDHPCEQIITNEKTTILLRYLQQQYEKKRTAEFLEGLPSFNKNNFSRFHPDTFCKNAGMKKCTVHFSTRDHPCEQVIITERATMLLELLQKQYEERHRTAFLKRQQDRPGPSGVAPAPRKKPKVVDTGSQT